ncbi:MAG TPA: 50S ribosomal protein L18 [Candidatus Marinimicrobia bacterium]|nr:50S ribosomal protein L18 [Candidatus Neomarinimicrobiota bacterium]
MSKIKEDKIRFSHRRNRSKKTAWFHPDRYRLCVYRSNMNIEAQIIDDFQGNTLISSSSKDKNLVKEIKKATSKVECSKIVGVALAERAIKMKIKKVVFDRNGYPYHGRIKALADAARESGLEF